MWPQQQADLKGGTGSFVAKACCWKRAVLLDSEFGLVFYSYLIGTLNLKFASGDDLALRRKGRLSVFEGFDLCFVAKDVQC